jgi:hypothetical protein
VRRAILAAVLVALLPAAAGAARAKPLVRPIDRDPLVVRGLRFLPAERVTVRVAVRGGTRLSKTVKAGASGAFTVRFVSLRLGACAVFTVSASGSRGSRSVYTEPFAPCGPAP